MQTSLMLAESLVCFQGHNADMLPCCCCDIGSHQSTHLVRAYSMFRDVQVSGPHIDSAVAKTLRVH